MRGKKIIYFLMLIVIGFFVSFYDVNASKDVYEFSYTGDYQKFVVPASGIYKLETWGAQGGQGSALSAGGKGGYSMGYVYLTAGQTIYVYVGGQGTQISSGTAGGGYNGGGHAQIGSAGRPSGGGGGATDIRTYIDDTGTWNNAESLKSRIIVAGGGGGGGYYSTTDYNFTGGAGGGTTGQKGYEISGNPSGTGGSQTAAGFASGKQSQTQGAFGIGGNGLLATSSAGGGGGGYYGGGGSYCAGGGGGSGFVTGLLTYNEEQPVTILGTEAIPTHDGTGTMTGNSGDGYAKITLVDADYEFDFEVTGAIISPEVSNEIFEYMVIIPSSVYETEITYDLKQNIAVLGAGKVTLSDATFKTFVVVDHDGNAHVYKLNIVYNKAILDDVQFEEIDFEFLSYKYDYYLEVSSDIAEITPQITTNDQYEISQTTLDYGTNKITIRAYNDTDNKEESVYNFYITRQYEHSSDAYTFTYTGDYETFVAPEDGVYKLEVWGAQGGQGSTASPGGKGGYSKGYYQMSKGEILYIYVGGQGTQISSGTAGGGYNGGGHAKIGTGGRVSGGGGGATDIRTFISTDGLWDNAESLASRIIVAGGGGGGGYYYTSASYNFTGGAGGGTTGQKGYEVSGNPSGTGGSQTAAGYTPGHQSETQGAFGIGGNGKSASSSAGGGGGGYYGGGGSYCAGGGGGSGFVAGLLSFEGDDPVTILGTEAIPTHDGTGTMTGNSGNGYAKISIVGGTADNMLASLETSVGTLSPQFASEKYEYNLYIDNSVTQLTLTGTSVLADSSIVGLGIVLINEDAFDHTVSVISNEGFVNNYVIHIERAKSDVNYLDGVIINGEEFASFDKDEPKFEITMPYDTEYIYLDAIKSDEDQTVTNDGLIVFDKNEAEVNVLVVSESIGESRSYTFIFKREASAKLKIVDFNNSFINYDFNSEELFYDVDVPKGLLSLNVTAVPYYEGTTVEIIGSDYLDYDEDNVATIKVISTLEGVETVTYEFKLFRTAVVVDEGYEYTGDYQRFDAPTSGIYLLETWGAQGGQGSNISYGGKGGYSKGYYSMTAGDILYIFVGGQGTQVTSGTAGGGYNGGGHAQIGSYKRASGGGGGATDIRTYIDSNGTWNNADSLKSRIIVAGGGGGGGWYYTNAAYNFTGGAGGGLTGQNGFGVNGNPAGSGGSQTAAGFAPGKQTQTQGAFGIGGTGLLASSSAGGGGGGYYGGGGSYCAGGGGGSSYIDGLLTYAADEPVALQGTEVMPTHDKTSVMTGNTGDGYARITLVKEVSSDNYLATLVLNDGDIPLDFKTSQQYYELPLTETDIKLKIDATPKDEAATVSGIGTFDIPPGKTTREITVTASDGSIRVYTLDINRPGSSDPYPERIDVNKMIAYLCDKDEEYCNYTYSSEKDNYGIYLPFQIEEVEISPVLKSKYQQVIYRKVNEDKTKEEVESGNIVFDSETATYEVEIISEDGSQNKIFTYTFKRDLTGNNYLQSLIITNPDIAFEFSPKKYEYYLTIDAEHDSYDVVTTTQAEKADVLVEGNTDLTYGMNDCIITVIAENGSTKNYIIHMYKKQDSNVFLSSLKVKNGEEELELVPTFSNVLNNYSVEVGPEVETVTIEAVAAGTNAKAVVYGNTSLSSGVNEFEVVVTSESGEVNTYAVSVIKAKDNNSKLENIEVEGYTIAPEFTPDTKEYYLDVAKSVTSLNVIVTPEKETTTYTIRGNNNLNKNLNEIVITSIAEDKTYTVYTIYVSKEISDNNYLSGIKITGGDPLQEFGISEEEFDKDTLTYEVTVGKEISTIKVEGTPEDGSATIVGNGSYALIAGDNIIHLKVTSEAGEEKVYTLTVTKPKDDDATLKEVLNNRGSIVTKLDESNYVINVQNEVNSIEITGIANSSLAKVVGNGTYTLTTGDNPIELIVTAEDGITTKKYTVNVVRDKSSNDDLDFLYVEEGGLSPQFNETIIYYEVKVPNNVELLTIEAITEDPNATYEIIGNDGLEVGVEKEIIIRVTAEDEENTKDYTLKVIRQAATEENLSLENLETNRGLGQTFNPDILSYYIEVENDITDITVTAKAFSETVTVLGPGTYDLQVGKNAISVFVIGESGVQRDYQIVVERKKSSDATLSSLVVKGSTLSPSFDKNTTEYKITTSKTELEFTTIKTTEAEATYEVIGNANFGVGENEVIIRVTAPDGTTKDYKIIVTIEASGNNNLASLAVDGYALTPTFHKGVTYYTVEVGNDINTVLIKAEAEDEGATLSGTGVKNVSVGTNTYEIVVTSAKGTEKKYVVAITKDGSDNNYLSSLYTSEGTLTPNFDKETLEYYLTVGSDVSTIEVNGTLEVITASTTAFKEYTLSDGLNEIEIPVISESGDIRIYKIYVTKKESISANIIDLKVEGYDLDQTFDKDVIEYFINVNNETTELNLNITLEDENATYEVTGNENFEVGMNKVYIVVTAKDGETQKTYTLFVNRNLSTNNYLSILDVSVGTLSPEFTKETLEYTVEVGNDVTSITISAQTEDSTAQITSGLGERQLVVGENIINIKVKSSIGVYRTYKVVVNRKKSENNYLSSLTVKGNNETLTLNETFDKTQNYYTLSVDSSIDYIQISGTKEDAKASLAGTGIKELEIGTNTFEITVTSEMGMPNTYTLTVEKAASSNNNVVNIIPSVGTLNKTFDPSVPDYELVVAEDDNYLSFEVELEDQKSVVSGNTEQIIVQGESERIITITAENGDTKTYTFKVIKKSISEARLESLIVKGYELDFNPDTFIYNLSVSAGKKELLVSEIEAIAKDANATVNLMGDLTLINDTINIYVIEVIAKDGYTTQEYRLNITTDNEEYTLRSEVYEINRESEYVIGSNPNTNVTNYISSFENEQSMLVIYDKDGNKIEDVTKLVGTSMMIKLEKDGVIYDSLKVIVRGDVTKDGKVDLTDQIKLENYVGKAVTFDDDELLAAEVTKDGKVNLTDQVELENYVGKANTDLND